MSDKKILILGMTGMLGHTLFTWLSETRSFDIYATARNLTGLTKRFSPELLARVRIDVDAHNFDSILGVIADIKPDIVINCIGIVKQSPAANDYRMSISVNALLPHRIALACNSVGARFIHISTDCVFNGGKGGYTENDTPNPTDFYGKTKLLGEVKYDHCLTLRTSIIGHELKGKYGLIEWFLAQKEKVRGYTSAIYSGFPTIELARIIGEYVIPNEELSGLYHVSSAPISKYNLLKLTADIYDRKIEIEPWPDYCSDRSLDSTLFRRATGYEPPSWPLLINKMWYNHITAPHYNSAGTS